MEMMLIKVSYNATNRSSLIEICSVMGAKILHVSNKHLLIEIHDSPEVVENFISLVRPFGIVEVQRTGTVAMSKN